MLMGLGVFGLLGLSILWPLLALPGYRAQQRRWRDASSRPNPMVPSSSIKIIIPAHNEERVIAATLESVLRSIQHLKDAPRAGPDLQVSVQVAANACTDNTSAIARRFPGVTVTERSQNSGKWASLKALAENNSEADWLICVDAGTLWPVPFLSDIVQWIRAHPEAMAVAPAYQPNKGGWLSRALWFFETSLKKLEVLCGGPVSLHGATVAYQAAKLRQAFASLGDVTWLNDDVVIPLALRALNVRGVIRYPVGRIYDAGAKTEGPDLARRNRMLLGNLQWVRSLLPWCFHRNRIAGLVAMRRLFRIFWAYWLVFLITGMAIACTSLILPMMLGALLLAAFSGGFRQLAGAAWVSLLAPYRIAQMNGNLEVSWK